MVGREFDVQRYPHSLCNASTRLRKSTVISMAAERPMPLAFQRLIYPHQAIRHQTMKHVLLVLLLSLFVGCRTYPIEVASDLAVVHINGPFRGHGLYLLGPFQTSSGPFTNDLSASPQEVVVVLHGVTNAISVELQLVNGYGNDVFLSVRGNGLHPGFSYQYDTTHVFSMGPADETEGIRSVLGSRCRTYERLTRGASFLPDGLMQLEQDNAKMLHYEHQVRGVYGRWTSDSEVVVVRVSRIDITLDLSIDYALSGIAGDHAARIPLRVILFLDRDFWDKEVERWKRYERDHPEIKVQYRE